MASKKPQAEPTFVQLNRKDELKELVSGDPLPLYKRILRNEILQGVLILVILSAGVIPLIYWLTYDNQDWNNEKPYICVIDPGYRVPCGGFNISEVECRDVTCCYDEKSLECYHTAPTQYFYAVGKDGMYRPSMERTPFDKPSVAKMMIDYFNYLEEDGRFRVVLHDASVKLASKKPRGYTVEQYEDKLALEVFRNSSGDRILSTGFGPLVASSDYWEWTVLLSTQYLFGLGQLVFHGNSTVSRVFYKNERDHHTIPAFMAFTNGSFHGMVVEHDGPLEVTVLPSKLIVLKSLVGRQITLNLFPGPTPKDVLLQMRTYNFTQPDDWMFDAQICRGGNVTDLRKAMDEYNKNKNKESGINYGIDCFNENAVMMIMKEETETGYLAELKTLITNIKQQGRKFSLVITPHVPYGEDYTLYKKAEDLDVLYKNNSGDVYIGRYKNIDVAFLDVSSPNINNWLNELINLITQTIELDVIDAISLLDNWPAEDTYEMFAEESFSYINENITTAMSHTIPWNLKTSKSENHIFTHNKYGYDFLKLIEKLIPNKPILTSTYNFGQNNPVITRNINTTWVDFRETMITNLYHSLFSHPLIASPVCGTKQLKTIQEEKICLRWYFMAASMPLFFANNDWPVYVSRYGAAVVKKALDRRKELVHYFKHFIRSGEPVSRPMFFDFYEDNSTFVLDEQYMIGDSLLVCLPVYPTSTLKVYLPKDNDWFEFWGGGIIEGNGWIMMNIIETDWPVFIKAGSIIPLRITETAGEAFSLISAYNCTKTTETETCTSEGVLRYDDAILNITLKDSVLKLTNIDEVKIEINCTDSETPRMVESIKIFTTNGTEFYSLNINLCEKQNEYSQNLSGTTG